MRVHYGMYVFRTAGERRNKQAVRSNVNVLDAALPQIEESRDDNNCEHG
jgi:hypothetical protein